MYEFQSWIQELADLDSELLHTAPPGGGGGGIINSTHHQQQQQRRRVLVLGLTQEERLLDPTVKTLFDDSIEVDIPTPEERTVILKACTINQRIHLSPTPPPPPPNHPNDDASVTTAVTTTYPAAVDTIPGTDSSRHLRTDFEDAAIESIAMKCHGYLAADLNALCIQAGVVAHGHGRTTLDKVQIQDFEEAMKSIRVSALRQNTSVQKVEPVYWSNIGGLENVKVKRDTHLHSQLRFMCLYTQHIRGIYFFILFFRLFNF